MLKQSGQRNAKSISRRSVRYALRFHALARPFFQHHYSEQKKVVKSGAWDHVGRVEIYVDNANRDESDAP